MGLSKNQIKLITGLRQKKYRIKNKMFVVEGIKAVDEFLNSKTKLLYLFFSDIKLEYGQMENAVLITEKELYKISALKSPNKVLAVFEIPNSNVLKNTGLIVALDGVNDPGNLGTIIRLCDWFGVDQLICSETTVDCYNPKVVQATMGSLTRVSIAYTDLPGYLDSSKSRILAADMNGETIYEKTYPEDAVLVMGNEANGLSNAVLKVIDDKIRIPRFGSLNKTESLNVATATAIILSEFRRGH